MKRRQDREQNRKIKGIGKRAFALLLAGAMAVSATDWSSLVMVKAKEREKTYEILGIETLSAEIKEQVLPLGAKESDIVFPESLKVTVRESVAEDSSVSEDEEMIEEDQEELPEENAGQKKEPQESEGGENGSTEQKENENPDVTGGENTSGETTEGESSQEGGESQESGNAGESEESQSGENAGSSGESHNSGSEGMSEGAQQEQNAGQTGAEATAQQESSEQPENSASAWNMLKDWLAPIKVYAAEEGQEEAAEHALNDPEEAQKEERKKQNTQQESREVTLTGITWEIDPAESDFAKFDGSRNGSVYAYVPVLPQADEEGDLYVLSKELQLPVIYVLVGKIQPMLLDSNGNTLNINELPLSTAPLHGNSSHKESEYGLIRISSENQAEYNGKTLTGEVTSSEERASSTSLDITDPARGVIVGSGVTLDLTIKDLKINRQRFNGSYEEEASAIVLESGATLNLTLEGDNSLYGGSCGAGICVPKGATLTITDKSTGNLEVNGGRSGAAGIGACAGRGGDIKTVGTIVIKGGTVEAWGSPGGRPGAGIGGSEYGTTGTITICGGNVTANGATEGAGIGGGQNGCVEAITIEGGNVVAVQKSDGCGTAIGTGGVYEDAKEKISCGTIRLTGGSITAQGDIGYSVGYDSYSDRYEGGSITITEGAYLNVTGKIRPKPEGTLQNYTMTFDIYDGRLTKDAEAKISLGGQKLAEKAKVTVSTPGTAHVSTTFSALALTGEKEFTITIGELTYTAKVECKEGETSYTTAVGDKFYPVTLEFYEQTITQDVTGVTVEIRKNGTKLTESAYYAPDTIQKKSDGYGTMLLYLPAGGNVDLSVTALGVNDGKTMSKTGQSITASSENRIVMLTPKTVTISPVLEEIVGDSAKIKVEVSHVGATLWYLEKNEGSPTAQELKESGNKVSVSGTTAEITLKDLAEAQHTIYFVAECGGVTSEVAKISFETSSVAEVISLQEETIGLYASLTEALEAAGNHSGSTVKLLQNAEIATAITVTENYTIDLNGKILQADYTSAQYLLTLKNGAELTILDSAGGGKVTGNDSKTYNYFCKAENGSELTIQGGRFEARAGKIWSSYGKTLIEGGEFYNVVRIQYIGDALAGGTFYGKVCWSGITSGNVRKSPLKTGYRFCYLDGEQKGKLVDSSEITQSDNEGYYIEKVKIVPLTEMTGTLTLPGEVVWGEPVTANLTLTDTLPEGEELTYTWYGEDKDGNVKMLQPQTEQDAQTTIALTDSYTPTDNKLGMKIWCEVKPVGASWSGVLVSEKREVLGRDIAKASYTEETLYFTGKPITKKAVSNLKYKDDTISSRDYEVVSDSFQNNVNISTESSKASFKIRGTGNYRGEKTIEFKIAYNPNIKEEAKVSPAVWTNRTVTVTKPNYQCTICPKMNGGYDYEKGFVESFSVDEESTSLDGTEIFYRISKGGEVSEEKKAIVRIDRTAPVWADASGNTEGYGICVKENWWRTLLNKISFGRIYNDQTLDITFHAGDELSGIARYYYYTQSVSDTASAKILTKEELDQKSFTKIEVDAGNSKEAVVKNAVLSRNGNYIIYAYAVDQAGNKSEYVCTDGIVWDTKGPTITIPNKWDWGTDAVKDTEVTIPVTLDEDATLLYFYIDDGLFGYEEFLSYVDQIKQYIAEETKLNDEDGKILDLAVKENGKWKPGFEGEEASIQITASGDHDHTDAYKVSLQKGNNELKITGLQPQINVTVWMSAIDQAGNVSGELQEVSFTTAKGKLTVEKLPEVTGFYGDTATNLYIRATNDCVTCHGDVVYGTWKITDTSTVPLEVGTTQECELTFESNAKWAYDPVTVKVTPTIQKRPLTIQVADCMKKYGEELPQIKFQIKEDAGSGKLVGSDTVETIADTLTLVTAATKDSDAGNYEFTVASSSPNYEVAAEYYDDQLDTTKAHMQKGTLTISKAEGRIVTDQEYYRSTRNVNYGDAPFSLGVTANHQETTLQYTVTDTYDTNGNPIADTDVAGKLLEISPSDGKLTIKGTGTAKITVSLPETKNYSKAHMPLTITVNIAKKSPGISQQIYKNYQAVKGGADSIDLTKYLQADCGTVNFGTVNVTGIVGTVDFEEEPAVVNGVLSYKVKVGTAGAKAEIKIPVTTDNYADGNIKVILELVDQMPVFPQGRVTLKNNTLTYGETLSGLAFNNVTFEGPDQKKVAGTLAFEASDTKPDAGEYNARWIFTPADDAYAPYSDRVTVTVKKAKPKLTKAPVTEEMVFNPWKKFDESILNDKAKTQGVVTGVDGSPVEGTWKFADPNVLQQIQQVGTRTYEIYFEPSPEYDKNYDCTDIKANVAITVKKIKPYVSELKLGSYTHGDYLYNQKLTGTVVCGDGMGGEGDGSTFANTCVSGTFTWKTPSTKLSHVESNGKTYEYIFTPRDTACETVTGSVAVTVNKAQNPPVMPGSTMNVANSCEKVSSVKLPAGWAWSTTDAETALSVGIPVSATVEYTAADKDNYENTTVTVQITRSSCEHKTTKVENAVPATCSKEGSTGDVVCVDCKAVVETASITAKNPANHTALKETVVRAATTSQTGLRVSECTDCGYHAEVTIPKLSGGSTGGNSGNGGSAPQPEPAGDNTGAGSQNTSGGSDSGSDNGNSNGGTGGGQGTATTPVSPKPQNPTLQQPEETRPGNTQQNRTNPTAGGTQAPNAAKPFIKGENGKEGWEVIHDEVTAAKEGETVSVDMNGATTVPGNILSQISGKDITLVLDMGNGITWSINGMSFTDGEIGDINFGVTYGEQAGKDIPVDVINNVTGERYSMNLTLAYDGEFGFSAVLSINMDGKNAGLYANLFYYNPESGELEFICAGQIGEDGNAELTFTHASDYTIVIDTEPMDQADAGDAVEAAADTDKISDADNAGTIEPAKEDTDTAAGWIILIVVILAVAAAAGGVVLQKRRRQK
jgi:hypothetical protein